MRKSDLQKLKLYVVNPMTRSVARRSAGPALLLDTRWWDLSPGADGPSFALAPEDAPRSTVLDADGRGARRGLLVVQANPTMAYASDFDATAVAEQLTALAEEGPLQEVSRLDRSGDPQPALDALRQILPAGLILNVVLLSGLQQPWGSESTVTCPACRTEADLDSAGRLRPHQGKDGQRCTPHTYRCPKCKKRVGLDTGNRVLSHTFKGRRCRMSNTQMSPEEREACFIR